jgi:hypothetical protein
MNVLFGSATREGAPGLETAALRSIELELGIVPERVASEHGSELWVAGDGGVILGHAADSGAHLLFLGTLHHPVPDWGPGAPVDDPQASARYLLERYRRLGREFLDGVVGQYAVVVRDPAQRSVLLCCDPLGHRTIYRYGDPKGGRLLFATNLLTLTKLIGQELRCDRSLEDFFLMYGFFPRGRTPFGHVVALEKGTILHWQAGAVTTSPIRLANPWASRTDAAALARGDECAAIDALYEGFMQALRDQAPTTERVGVLLGGFDSALVAAGLQRLGKKVETFSFGYDDGQYNQPHVDTLQRLLGHEHHWVPLTRDLLADGLRSFCKYFNQPTNWPNYVIQTADICDRMRQRGIRFCFTGDGCDSVFMGYPGTYRRAVLFESLPTLPERLRTALTTALAQPTFDRKLGHPYRVALNMVRALGREMPARGFLSFRIMDEVSVAQLRQGETPPQEQPPEALGRELAAPHAGLPGLRLAYLGKAAVSPNRNKMVGSSDRSGIAILSPYMHPGMKQLSLSLPEELCRPNQDTPSKVTGKYILMRMAEEKQLLPRDVIYQPKVAAVDGPIDAWYAGPMRPLMLELMKGLPFEYSERYANSLLDEKMAERLFKKYAMTDKVISHAASLLVTYSRFTSLAREAGSAAST